MFLEENKTVHCELASFALQSPRTRARRLLVYQDLFRILLDAIRWIVGLRVLGCPREGSLEVVSQVIDRLQRNTRVRVPPVGVEAGDEFVPASQIGRRVFEILFDAGHCLEVLGVELTEDIVGVFQIQVDVVRPRATVIRTNGCYVARVFEAF